MQNGHKEFCEWNQGFRRGGGASAVDFLEQREGVGWAMRFFFLSALLLFGWCSCGAQAPQNETVPDSDHDGLADAVEQSLLEQFQPRFMISGHDCSGRPAEFTPLLKNPVAAVDNGVIYGQVFPSRARYGEVELHYYDLWRRDCGQAGHDLDAEHVSVLVGRDSSGIWKARYWYAAAHEDTLCDVSQVTRAKSIHAEDRGAEVWISAGKHGAFLSKAVCGHGCGADDCEGEEELADHRVVNLGEISAPMNGSTWIASSQWPLGEKMGRSDFNEALTARVESLPPEEIAWANPGKRPVQAAILGGDAAVVGAATGLRATDSALTVADTSSSVALDTASRKTGNALAKSYRRVLKALRAVGGSTKRGDAK
jgi:hypothetical protein